MTFTRLTLPTINEPFWDIKSGQISRTWWIFFNDLFRRTGGPSSPGTTQIVSLLNQLTQVIIDVETDSQTSGQESAISEIVQALDEIKQQFTSYPNTSELLRRFDAIEVELANTYTHGELQDPDLHALASSAEAGFMSAPDKLKLDNLPTPVVPPVSLIADVVAGNSTADFDILTETLPANMIAAGFSQRAIIISSIANDLVVSGTLDFWLKLNGIKVFTQSLSTPPGGGPRASRADFFLTARTIGAGGTMQLAGDLSYNGTPSPSVNAATTVVDTTVSNTVTLGVNWNAAVAANIATIKYAIFTTDK